MLRFSCAMLSAALSCCPHRFDEMEPSEEEKLENKGWLQDHLVNVASFSYTDLQAMKERGASCFPPSYNILDFFTKVHHGCLVKKVSVMRSKVE